MEPSSQQAVQSYPLGTDSTTSTAAPLGRFSKAVAHSLGAGTATSQMVVPASSLGVEDPIVELTPFGKTVVELLPAVASLSSLPAGAGDSTGQQLHSEPVPLTGAALSRHAAPGRDGDEHSVRSRSSHGHSSESQRRAKLMEIEEEEDRIALRELEIEKRRAARRKQAIHDTPADGDDASVKSHHSG